MLGYPHFRKPHIIATFLQSTQFSQAWMLISWPLAEIRNWVANGITSCGEPRIPNWFNQHQPSVANVQSTCASQMRSKSWGPIGIAVVDHTSPDLDPMATGHQRPIYYDSCNALVQVVTGRSYFDQRAGRRCYFIPGILQRCPRMFAKKKTWCCQTKQEHCTKNVVKNNLAIISRQRCYMNLNM